MKINKIIFVISILTASFAAHAEQSGNELGLWERFCVQNKIGDACGKAAKSLSAQVSQFDQDQTIEQTMNLQKRLQTVSELGCSLKNTSCCQQIESMTIDTVDGEIMLSQQDPE